jgi:hypothetical protein
MGVSMATSRAIRRFGGQFRILAPCLGDDDGIDDPSRKRLIDLGVDAAYADR